MCHVDATGGGMRNDYGRNVFELVDLPMTNAALPAPDRPLDARLTETVSLGADLRVLYQHLRKTDADLPRMDSFYPMENSLYVAADLLKNATLYLAPTFYGGESVFFEAAAIFPVEWFDGMNGYIKVGRFTPAYGYKLPNHSVFIRKDIGFNVRSKETGVELGVEPGPFSVQVSVFNGVPERTDSEWDDNRAKGLSTRASYRLKRRWLTAELGFSGYYNIGGNSAEDDPADEDTRIEDTKIGGFGGLSIGRFAYIVEADLHRIDDRTEAEPNTSFASFQELAFLVTRGFELIATYELWDGDTDVVGNAAHRFGGGFELYPWPFAEFKMHYRYISADDRHRLAGIHEAMGVAHVFF